MIKRIKQIYKGSEESKEMVSLRVIVTILYQSEEVGISAKKVKKLSKMITEVIEILEIPKVIKDESPNPPSPYGTWMQMANKLIPDQIADYVREHGSTKGLNARRLIRNADLDGVIQ